MKKIYKNFVTPYLKSENCEIGELSDGNCLDIIFDVFGDDGTCDFDRIDFMHDFLAKIRQK